MRLRDSAEIWKIKHAGVHACLCGSGLCATTLLENQFCLHSSTSWDSNILDNLKPGARRSIASVPVHPSWAWVRRSILFNAVQPQT